MTDSIFDSTGNLIDAFSDRAAALDCLAGIAHAEPESAGEVFLIAQDEDGNTVGETVHASSVSIPPSSSQPPKLQQRRRARASAVDVLCATETASLSP